MNSGSVVIKAVKNHTVPERRKTRSTCSSGNYTIKKEAMARALRGGTLGIRRNGYTCRTALPTKVDTTPAVGHPRFAMGR